MLYQEAILRNRNHINEKVLIFIRETKIQGASLSHYI